MLAHGIVVLNPPSKVGRALAPVAHEEGDAAPWEAAVRTAGDIVLSERFNGHFHTSKRTRHRHNPPLAKAADLLHTTRVRT